MDTDALAADFKKRYGADGGKPEVFSVGMPVHLVGIPQAEGSRLLSCTVSMTAAAAIRKIDDLVVELERTGSNLRLASPVSELDKMDDEIFGLFSYIGKRRYKIPGMQLMLDTEMPEGILRREAETAAAAGAMFRIKGRKLSANDLAMLCADYRGEKESRPDFGVMFRQGAGSVYEGRSAEVAVFETGGSLDGLVLILADTGRFSMGRKRVNATVEENRRAERCLYALCTEGGEGFAKEFTDVSCAKEAGTRLLESLAENEIILGVRYLEYMQLTAVIAAEERTDAAVSLITDRCERFMGRQPLIYITRSI